MTDISVRRLITAGLFGAALVLAPAVVDAAAAGPAPNHLAGCTMTRSGGSSSMVCSPDTPAGGIGGAPSQQDLTAKNAQRARSGGRF